MLKWEESIVRCRILTLMTMGVVFSLAWSAEKDTPAAAATRKKLQTKISVQYKDVSLMEITDDIKQKVNDASGTDLSIYLDGPGGVSGNSTLSYSAKDKTVAEILNGMLKPSDLGYVVVSKEYKTYNGRYDGWVLIVKGKERGYPEKEDSGKESASKEKVKEKASTEKPKTKPAVEKPSADKPEDDADKFEREAGRQLKYAKTYIEDGKNDVAIKKLKEIVKKYPKTKPAEEAKGLLEKLEK